MRFGRDVSRGALGLPRFEPDEEESFIGDQYLLQITIRTGRLSPEKQYVEFTVTLAYTL